jgi:DNA-directed RNA polymerase specialized sigma24 family protein
MNSEEDFQKALALLRAGDEAEAFRLFHRFGNRLVQLASLNLNDRVRQKVDPEEVADSVLRTFLRRTAAGQFDFADWNNVWSMLVVIAVRKCGHQLERFNAARRDVHREQALAGPGGDSDFHGWEAVAAGPTPLQAIMLNETIERLLDQFSSPSERRIVEMSLDGSNPQEICTETHRSERTVHRVRKRMREWLEQQRDS